MTRIKNKNVRNNKSNSKEKKEGRIGSIVIGGIIIFLMVFSIAGVSVYHSNNNNNPLEYNGHKFVAGKDNFFYTTVNDKELKFRSLPEQTLSLNYDTNITPIWKNSVYRGILIDPTMDRQALQIIEQIRYELSQEIPNTFTAITEKSDLYSNMPVLSCENASAQMPFLVFKMPELNTSNYEAGKVSLEGNCIIIRGDFRNMFLAKDRLVYEYFDFFKVKEK